MYLFYKGSRNEYQGITGLSHFFEHMMFNGAKNTVQNYSTRLWSLTEVNNAYENVTVYTNWFPASASEVIFDLEGDRFQV
jgi:predicted Zn-dependent peptidase